MTLKERAKKLKTDIPAVFLALRKRETPVSAKLLAALTVAYALSPIDLIPDFIPVLGHLDDALIVPLLLALSYRLIPSHIRERSRARAEREFPSFGGRWRFVFAVVLTWAAAIAVAVLVFVRLVR